MRVLKFLFWSYLYSLHFFQEHELLFVTEGNFFFFFKQKAALGKTIWR